MVDIKPQIAALLENEASIGLSYNRNENPLPFICLTETDNSARIVINGQDRVSSIVIQLDLYGETAKETEELAARVSALLTENGGKRSFSQLITDERTPRRCMRFTFFADEAEGRIVSL